ncbi:tRNA modification GTPase-like protein mss1 [Xylariales sp. PMI_506]|nr:tRNA modification GTPase-like protein mss1 [Xylariales sp. PMI_506]
MLRRLLRCTSSQCLQHRLSRSRGGITAPFDSYVSESGLRPTYPYRIVWKLGSTRRHISTSLHQGDTIYALSTAQGKAGIAVIRVSGPHCREIYESLCPSKALPKPRYVAVRSLYHPASGETNVLDSDAVVVYLPGPRTVTGEDVLELHVHGGGATVKAVLSAIPSCSTSGKVRYAEPGEFTRRAFFNDRLDLAQVEALSDTLSAETEQQRRAAVRGSSGSLGKTYEDWRQSLLQARAEVEAIIDFSEDQHFDESPKDLLQNVSRLVEEILESIATHEVASQRSELLRNGICIALLGPPNVGKSSLMNQIIGREASIVSGEAGTTRDIVEAHLDIRGYLSTFADTAGFRSAGDRGSDIGAVELEGIKRARAKALESDVVMVLVSIETDTLGEYYIHYDTETLELLRTVGHGFIVLNKRDALPKPELDDLLEEFQVHIKNKYPEISQDVLLVSCKEAQNKTSKGRDLGGVHGVANRLVSLFEDMTSLPSSQQDLHGVTQRQMQLLDQCRKHLEDYVGNTSDEFMDDLNLVIAAEDLRYAANCLARITGRGETSNIEEVLGVIFEK